MMQFFNEARPRRERVNVLKWGCLLMTAVLLGACAETGDVKQADIEDRTGGKATSAVPKGASAGPAKAAPGSGVQASGLGPGGMEGVKAMEGQPGAKPLGEGASPLKDPSSPLFKRSVYFDYDSVVVKDEYRPMLEAHAQYLLSTPDASMILQGNTDERGSREYNLALGQRRAEAVSQVLALLGVPASQVEAVSFGEEKPRAQGATEEAWSQNRRTDIVYKGE
jgi:peptidoglycan-associated lipoprotein